MDSHLPIYEVKEAILQAARTRGTLVLTAPTGSGKSTQAPRFLAEVSAGKVLVLQPRRLAARMLAERVAEECGEKVGETVGFQTRYERAYSSQTKILFITEGILTRLLVSQPSLPGIGCIIFDEFHERSIHTDLGIAMAWQTRQTRRQDLILAVMSATMDAVPVSRFLGDAPVIESTGRLYPVDITYCDPATKLLGAPAAAFKALRELVASGVQGDVLIFMPGGYEIRKTIELCQRAHWQEELVFLPLYGDLPPVEQRRVMSPFPQRKVIVATNIAETSLTIPGVRHVIDSGLARISRYDAIRGIDSLHTEPIARDATDQRAGRAGREAPGTCRRLWPWIEQSAKPSRTIPEIQRVDLADAVLAVSAYGYDSPADFPWFDAPPPRMLEAAHSLLRQLNLIRSEGGLTELGRQLSSIPAHPRIALLMWFGAESGCFFQTAWAAALLSERPLITGITSTRRENTERRQDARRASREQQLPASDFEMQIELVKTAEAAHFAQDFCDKLGIHAGAARDIARAARDYQRLSLEQRVTPKENRSSVSSSLAFLQCLLRVFPDRLARRIDGGTLVALMANGRRGELSLESVVREDALFVAGELREVGGSGASGNKTLLSLCSGVSEEWLLDLFPDAWEESDEVFWDDRKQQVVRHQTLVCLGVTLEDKLRSDPEPDRAAAILAEQLIAGKEPVPNWNEDVTRWIDRVTWVSQLFPEETLPPYDEAGRKKILTDLCQGETSLKKLKGKDTLAYVKNLLSWKQQQFVEQMAPDFLRLPNGRKMKLHYIPGQQAKGSAKIYDLYDLPDLPVIANGRAKVLLDILAPNFRTVQITDDLANFWKVLYPKIKPELARRYPRHPWR